MILHVDQDLGRVRLGLWELPGVFRALQISQDLRIDRKRIQGRSGTRKEPQGWGDAEVRLTLLLEDDEQLTKHNKLAMITGEFKATDKYAKPKLYTLVNQHVAARRLGKVIFRSLASRDDNERSWIMVELLFEEHDPPVIKLEKAAKGKLQTAEQAALRQFSDISEAYYKEPGVSVDPDAEKDAQVIDFVQEVTGADRKDVADVLTQTKAQQSSENVVDSTLKEVLSPIKDDDIP